MTNDKDLETQLRSLTQEFVAGLPEQWGGIEIAWTRVWLDGREIPAFEQLLQQVHSLAGAAGTLGFMQIAQAASQLQGELRSIRAGSQKRPGDAVLSQAEAPLQALRRAVYAGEQIELAELAHRLGSAKEATASLQDERSNRLIYMVEDDPLQAAEMAAQIGYFGYTLQIYHLLDDLEDALQHALPAAILMDISFPEGKMAGLNVIAALREKFPHLPPIIFVSMNDDMPFRLEAVRVGGEAYFTKPVDVDALIDVLDRLIFHEVVSPYRILIVDDLRVQASYYAAQLKKVGMVVEIVSDPLQVIDHLISFNPDLVLLDMYMPDCTGMELAKVIRQMEQFISVPIVFLSSETDKDKQMAAMGLGGDDFLTKPDRSSIPGRRRHHPRRALPQAAHPHVPGWADRPAQPHHHQGAPRPGGRARPPARRPPGFRHVGSGSFQARQRHLWPRHRRPGAEESGPFAQATPAQLGYHRALWGRRVRRDLS